MAIDKESLKKMFPNLYRELEEGEAKVSIDAVRDSPEQAEAESAQETEQEVELEEVKPQSVCNPDKLRHFNPTAVDFIRRCDNETQAEEIIAYLQKKGEITKEFAEKLLSQLKCEGVRSFGPKKEENYYFREGGIF